MIQRFTIVLLVWLGLIARGQAQEPLQDFKQFFTPDMTCVDGVFPVYTSGNRVFVEIPKACVGREIAIGAQIDRGFDLLSRPAEGLGVVRVLAPDSRTICFQQPFYEERMLGERPAYRRSFDLSNRQGDGTAYPVVTYSPRQGAVIEVTEQLLNGDGWFRYSYPFIRSLTPDLSRLTRVHPFKEGVSFTIRRHHGFEGEQNRFSSSLILLPEGSVPLDVTCVMRLLPLKEDPIRLADPRAHYRSIGFKDYAQNPYGMVRDSLILHWDLSRPLVFYVDTLFPKEHFMAVKRGVLAWNEAFRKTGMRGALQVAELPKGCVAAEQRALIAYDLRLPGVKETLTAHPRTGEILSARLNIGHGFLRDCMDDYLLRWGADDARVTTDRFSKVVEAELLQREVTRAVGRLLGLADRPTADGVASAGLSPAIEEADVRAIAFGYGPTRGKDCYARREQLRKWLRDVPEPPADVARGLENLLRVLPCLDRIVYHGRRPQDQGHALSVLYRKAIGLYAAYLKQLADRIGGPLPGRAQRQAMAHLDAYLFHPRQQVDCDYVKANLLEDRNKVLYPQLNELFGQLLGEKTIAALRRQALEVGGYGDSDFFADLWRGLFNGFDPAAPTTYAQLDMQYLCVQAWLEALRTTTDPAVRLCLERELQTLHRQLQALSRTHTQPAVRDMYELMCRKVER